MVSLALRIALVLAAVAGGPKPQQKPPEPTVTPPVTPSESDQDLRKLPPSKPWKPGDPVQEVPDLKQSGVGDSSTRGPVKPRKFEGDLHKLPLVRPTSTVGTRLTGGSHELVIAGGTFSVHGAGPFAFESLWTEGRCAAASGQALHGLYDKAAERWLMGRWAPLSPGSAFHYCVALSRTSNPVAGGWILYDFPLPMYRAGSSIELASNAYSLVIGLGGARIVFVFDRSRMLEGAPAAYTRMPSL